MSSSRSVVVAVTVAVAIVAFLVGARQPEVELRQARCLSATGTISCQYGTGAGGAGLRAEVAVPRDVAWTDSDGVRHDHGRPACLPATGRGLAGPVTLGVLPDLEVEGSSYDQVVWVGC